MADEPPVFRQCVGVEQLILDSEERLQGRMDLMQQCQRMALAKQQERLDRLEKGWSDLQLSTLVSDMAQGVTAQLDTDRLQKLEDNMSQIHEALRRCAERTEQTLAKLLSQSADELGDRFSKKTHATTDVESCVARIETGFQVFVKETVQQILESTDKSVLHEQRAITSPPSKGETERGDEQIEQVRQLLKETCVDGAQERNVSRQAAPLAAPTAAVSTPKLEPAKTSVAEFSASLGKLQDKAEILIQRANQLTSRTQVIPPFQGKCDVGLAANGPEADSPERGRLFQSPFLPVKCGSPSVPEWNDAWSTSTNSPLDKYRESRSLSPGIMLTRANSRFEKNLELPAERGTSAPRPRPSSARRDRPVRQGQPQKPRPLGAPPCGLSNVRAAPRLRLG